MSNNSITVSKKQEISGNEKKKPGQKDQSAQSSRLVQNINSADENCISGLKSVIQELRLEIQCIMEEQQKELVAQLNIQKGDMLQREAILHSQINFLKNDMESLSEKLRQLIQTESERKLELERLSSERQHLLEMLTELQRERDEKDLCIHCSVNKNCGSRFGNVYAPPPGQKQKFGTPGLLDKEEEERKRWGDNIKEWTGLSVNKLYTMQTAERNGERRLTVLVWCLNGPTD